MSASLATVSYIGATILFILSLGGLSNQQTALRGNLYGMIGMTLAVLATVFGPQVTWAGLPWIIGAMVIGGSIGSVCGAHGADDADARTGRADAQHGRSGRLLVGFASSLIRRRPSIWSMAEHPPVRRRRRSTRWRFISAS